MSQPMLQHCVMIVNQAERALHALEVEVAARTGEPTLGLRSPNDIPEKIYITFDAVLHRMREIKERMDTLTKRRDELIASEHLKDILEIVDIATEIGVEVHPDMRGLRKAS